MELPRDAYVTESWLNREQETLFARSWVFAGLESDLKKSGDYLTAWCGRFPILVIRDKAGQLNAYHNICKHRGAALLEGKGQGVKSLVCPYHRWTYALDGSLRGVPEQSLCFPDLNKDEFSLSKASVGVFKGLVFINPSTDVDFEKWIEPIENAAWPHDLDAKDMKPTPALTYDMKCDWKVFVENGLDGYHLPYLHSQSLGGPPVTKNEWEPLGDHLIWYALDGKPGEKHALPRKNRDAYKSVFTKAIKSTQKQEFGGVYFLFPSTFIDASPYSFSVTSVVPKETGRSHLIVNAWVGPGQSTDDRKYIPGYDKTTNTISSEHWKTHALKTNDFQTEDVWICEQLQRNLYSPSFKRGPLAKGKGAEDSIRHFQSTYSKYMNA